MRIIGKGKSKEVQSVQEILDFARELGYTQIIVLQNGERVTPETIDFSQEMAEVLPYDKFKATRFKVNEEEEIIVDDVDIIVDHENKVILITGSKIPVVLKKELMEYDIVEDTGEEDNEEPVEWL